jgi:hypothetical protein
MVPFSCRHVTVFVIDDNDLLPSVSASSFCRLKNLRSVDSPRPPGSKPSIAALEAALAGCTVVITNRGSTREYFGDRALYCDPQNVASIRVALDPALELERTHELARRIRNARVPRALLRGNWVQLQLDGASNGDRDITWPSETRKNGKKILASLRFAFTLGTFV